MDSNQRNAKRRHVFLSILIACGITILAILTTFSPVYLLISCHTKQTESTLQVFRRQDQTPIAPPYLPDPGIANITTPNRGPGGPWDYGPYKYFCGIFHTADPSDARKAAQSLLDATDTFSVPPGCLRAYCKDTTATYVCNDNNDTVLIGSDGIGWMASRLGLLCCDDHHGMSGQMFHPELRWNVVVGYGNCRHGATDAPSTYGTGNGGVNGNCVPSKSRPPPGG